MFTSDQVQEIKRLVRAQVTTQFSDDQIQEIKRLINAEITNRIAKHNTEKIVEYLTDYNNSTTSGETTDSYHTLNDLRCVILDNIDWLRQQLSTDIFHITLIRHYVLQLVEPTPYDLKLDSNGQTKIEHQINNVLKASKKHWLECPFESVPGMRGSYRFKKHS